ncbi:hypothetical protein SLE2022_288960 [Rubroshorea leprosula]
MGKPPIGCLKLSMNGSALHNPGPAACDGVSHDHFGRWIAGFARNIGITSVLGAEFLRIRDGLIMARNQNIQNLIVEIDSLVVFCFISASNIVTIHFTL